VLVTSAQLNCGRIGDGLPPPAAALQAAAAIRADGSNSRKCGRLVPSLMIAREGCPPKRVGSGRAANDLSEFFSPGFRTSIAR